MSTLRFPPPRVRLAILLSIGLLLLAGCGAGSGSFFSTGTFLVVAGLFLASLGLGGCAGEKFFVVGRPTPASSPSPTVSPSPGPSPAPPPLDFAGRHTGLGGFEPLDVALGDLDGDGDLDAVSADAFFARTVVVNLNNGRGGLQLGGYYSVGYGTRGVATGDVDGDADLDIAAANYISGTMGVLFNQGDGTFVSGTPVDTGYATTSVDLGDLDGDGDLDAVAGNSAGDFVAVLRNDGSGTFVGAGTFATQGPTVEVALGDLDGDGALDLAAVNDQGAGGQVAVLLNEGSGAFGAAYLFDAGPYPSRLALGDINGDGALDVATDSGYGDAYLLINQGSRGSPDFAGPYSFYALYPQGVALGDVDGDGHIDLVTASRYSEPERPYGFSLAILPGDGQGGFGEPRTFYTGEFPRTAVLGDADGDGNLDAFTADTYSYTVSCLLNRGDGTLEEAPVFAAGPDGSDLAAGDLDGDGDLDLVASDRDAGYAYLLRNQGKGIFLTEAVPPAEELLPGEYKALALGDVDGDGETDIVLAPYNQDGHLATLLNDGNGNFYQVVLSEASFPEDLYGTSAALGDLNGDGDLDLVWSSPFGYVLVGLGDGSGGFADPGRYDTYGYDTLKVALGDLDGDGDLDIVAASYYGDLSGYGVAVLLNNGAGLDPAETFYSGFDNQALALGDLDGDGDLDVAVTGGEDTEFLYALLGDGRGFFSPFSAQLVGVDARDLELADFDDDGNLDAVTANEDTADSSVLLGKGDGTFARPLGFGWGLDPVAVVPGDLDGDGRLDFAGLADFVPNRPFSNDVYVLLQR